MKVFQTVLESPKSMTETTFEQRSARRFDLARLRTIFLRPAQAFREMTSEARATWSTPMLVLTVTAILVVLVSGYLKSRAAMMGEVTLPPDWEYWTLDMQNNFMQAQQATQGPVFLYVMPMVGSLTGLWLGWLLLAALLHFGSTVLGGRGSMQGALNLVAWGSLPFAVRDILRIIFMLAAGHTIIGPSLSGFAAPGGFLAQFLARVDVFLVWQIVLLAIGFAIADGLPRNKAVVGIVTVMLLVLLAQAGLGTLTSGLGGTAIQRPFF